MAARMDFHINSVFPRSLYRFTSFVASTANSSFGRVLSFTGSFNDRTSLIDATTALPSQAVREAPEPPLTTTGDAFDIEAATTTAVPVAVADGGGGAEGQAGADEPKRVAKSVQTVCVFVASASLVMFVNLPSKPDAGAGLRAVLYSVNLAFICLSLFTSLGLSMFSIVARPGEPAVARVQKRAMLMAMAFVLASFTLRMTMTLPAASLEFAWVFFLFFLFAGAMVLYLSLTWEGNGRYQDS